MQAFPQVPVIEATVDLSSTEPVVTSWTPVRSPSPPGSNPVEIGGKRRSIMNWAGLVYQHSFFFPFFAKLHFRILERRRRNAGFLKAAPFSQSCTPPVTSAEAAHMNPSAVVQKTL